MRGGAGSAWAESSKPHFSLARVTADAIATGWIARGSYLFPRYTRVTFAEFPDADGLPRPAARLK